VGSSVHFAGSDALACTLSASTDSVAVSLAASPAKLSTTWSLAYLRSLCPSYK
jgi:hypothetical protein